MERQRNYDLYCKFDVVKHKETFTNYLEVMILSDGTIEYAVPSHQEKAAILACNKLGVSRQELIDMCPEEFYFDYMSWLLSITGTMAVWENFYLASSVTNEQISSLEMLKKEELYKGPIPQYPIGKSE